MWKISCIIRKSIKCDSDQLYVTVHDGCYQTEYDGKSMLV